MKNRIKQHLTDNPSYFKWSAERLAMKYGCAYSTMTGILKELKVCKTKYLQTLGK